MLMIFRLLLLLLLQLITTVPSALFYVIRTIAITKNQHQCNRNKNNHNDNLMFQIQQQSFEKYMIQSKRQTQSSIIGLTMMVKSSSSSPSSVASQNVDNGKLSTAIKKRIPIELIGATGRMGSQWLRMLHNDHTYMIHPVMRGICIGSYSTNSNIPIIVTTPSSIWQSIYYQQTLYHRKCDLIFIGNGILYHTNNNNSSKKIMIQNVTYVVPHYAILKYGDSPSISTNTSIIPTYVYGKHSQFVLNTLRTKDNIISIHIIDNPYEMYMIILRKLLWSSCMWLLCHDPYPTTNDNKIEIIIPDHPRTVSQVHQYQSYQLYQLVNELLPQFHQLIIMQYNNNNDDPDQSLLLSSLLLSSNDIIQYMESYSLSIPNAIPNKQLAIKEIYDRNGIFIDDTEQQSFHQQLIQRVAGIDIMNELFHHNIDRTNIHNDYQDSHNNINLQSNSPSIMIDVDINGIKIQIKDISSFNHMNDVNDVSFIPSDHLTLLGRRRIRIIDKTNHDRVKEYEQIPSTTSTLLILEQQQEQHKMANKIDSETFKTIHDDTKYHSNSKKNIVIIGGGIMGTSIALQIAKQKTDEDINIIVLDRLSSSDNNDNGLTTNASWGWINSNQKQPYHYHQLNELGMSLWKNDNHIKHLPIWNGSIVQNRDLIPMNQLLLLSSQYPIEGPLSRQQLLKLEPNAGCGFNIMMESSSSSSSSNSHSTQTEKMTDSHDIKAISDDDDQQIVDLDGHQRQDLHENHHQRHNSRYSSTTDSHPPVYYFPSEGHVDPIETVRTMKKAAKELGVEFRDDCNVTRIIYDDDNEKNHNNINRHCNDDSNSTNIISNNKRKIRRIIGVEYETSRHDLDNNNLTQLKQHVSADIVVVAAGIGTSTDMLGGIPLLHRPGTIAFFEKKKTGSRTASTASSVVAPIEVASSMTSQIDSPLETNDKDNKIANSMTKLRSSHPTLNHILVDTINQVHVLERNDGIIVAGGGYLQIGGLSSDDDMSMSDTATTMMARTKTEVKNLDQNQHQPHEEEKVFVNRLSTNIKQLAPNSLNDISFVSIASAIRPMPHDGLPAIGFNYRSGDNDDEVSWTNNKKQSRLYLNDDQSALSPSRDAAEISNPLYIAVTHSGITLAPILSILIAIEILHDIELDILQPYRPTRFRSKS